MEPVILYFSLTRKCGIKLAQHDDIVTSCIFAATVLQITPAKRRPKVEGPPVLSPAWFDAQAEKKRRQILYRQGI